MKRLWLVLVVAFAIGILWPTTAFAAPWLISPANSATVPRNATNGWYPYLQWGNSNPDLTTYMFQIAVSPAALSDGTFVSDNVVLANYGIFNKYYNYQPLGVYLYPGTYYWHVLDMFPSGGGGFSAWSPTWSFTVPAGAQQAMSLVPNILTFTMDYGGSTPSPKTVTFGCNPSGSSWQWQTHPEDLPASASWLTEAQLSQTQCSYSVNPAGLAPGTYSTSMKVEMWYYGTSTDVAGSPYWMPITLVINQANGMPTALSTITRLSGPSSVKVRRTLKLTGTVAPSVAPGKVTIVKQRYYSGKWRSAGSARISVVSGKYRYSFKPTKRGKWRFMAKYSGGLANQTTYRASSSGYRSVKVK